jgi:hypothetical protein
MPMRKAFLRSLSGKSITIVASTAALSIESKLSIKIKFRITKKADFKSAPKK